jgi:hypothetical protein
MTAKKTDSDRTRPRPPRDLVEFHQRWREFRPFAQAAAAGAPLGADEREVVRWLIELADRIGDKDIQ